MEDLNFDFLDEIEVPSIVDLKPVEPKVKGTIKAESTAIKVAGGCDKALAQSAIEKINKIKKELNLLFFDREEVINNCFRALVGGQSMLLLGPPGTGKSALTNELCSRIDGGKFFSWLLNKTSDPSEILGPYSLKELENDRFKRITDGKMCDANIVFMDEIFKANDAILNIMLPILNEKIIYNDGKAQKIPLISMFAASNEFPENDDLAAVYDRLIFRMWVDYINDVDMQHAMFNTFLEKRAGSKACTNERTILTFEELYTLQEASRYVSVNKTILKTFTRLMSQLYTKKSIRPSDRRLNECLKIMQVNAVLDGRNKVTVADFAALTYVLWEDLNDIPEILKIIEDIAFPYFKDITNMIIDMKSGIADVKEYYEGYDNGKINKKELQMKILELVNSLDKIEEKGGKLIKELDKKSYHHQLLKDGLELCKANHLHYKEELNKMIG